MRCTTDRRNMRPEWQPSKGTVKVVQFARDQVGLRSRVELRACVEGEKVVGLRTLARMRSEVRELEAKHRDLDRLIAALDRRYASLWAREG